MKNMKENSDYTERRQHTRSSAKSIVVGILNSDSSNIIGSITDISLGGVKLTYNELEMDSPKHPINSIDLIVDCDYLMDIPCYCTWNKKVGMKPDSELTNLRRYGIQFGKLNPWELSLLRSIIDYRTSLGINGITSDDHITYS